MMIRATIRPALLAASVALASIWTGGVPAHAQDAPQFEPDAYTTVMTQEEIAISGDRFVIADVIRQNYPDGENEQVFVDGLLDNDVPAALEVTWVDDSDTPDETMELWVDGLAEAEGIDDLRIDNAGLDGDVYWYYVTGTVEGEGIVFYIQVTEDVEGNTDMLESVLTTEGALVDAIEAAQDDIEIGEGTFLDDIDLDDLEGLTNGESFRDGEPDDADSDGS